MLSHPNRKHRKHSSDKSAFGETSSAIGSDKPRSSLRFRLQLPITIKRLKDGLEQSQGETRNISIGGMYFCTTSQLDEGERIEIAVPLPPELRGDGDTWELCRARMVRVEQSPNGELGVGAIVERYDVVRDAS